MIATFWPGSKKKPQPSARLIVEDRRGSAGQALPLGVHLVGMNPRAFYVGEEDLRCAGDAEARVDAEFAVIDDLHGFAVDEFDAVAELCWRRRPCGGR